MSSTRGAAGAVKPKLHNVNSIYAGKNQNAVKAPGVGKHGGLQSLGKTTAVVRRMPPPATLPSLRAESQGQDPNISLVPQGGTGWAKGDTNVANGATTEAQSVAKSSGNVVGSTPTVATTGTAANNTFGGINSSGGTHTTDLRPTWAKQPNVAETQAVALQNANTVTASSRDFPSLAAATAAAGKQTSNALTESLKPQKSGSWRAGGSSAASRNEGDAHAHLGLSYSVGTGTTRVTERQLPSRYYDAMAMPSPPPTAVFQVPKLQPAISVVTSGLQDALNSQTSTTENGQTRKTSYIITTNAPSVMPQYPANVAVPPPNYSRPPPNYIPVQMDPAGRCGSTHGAQSLSLEDGKGGKLTQPKSGPGDEGGCEQRFAENMRDNVVLGSTLMPLAHDMRNLTRRDFYDNRGNDFDKIATRGENEWQVATHGNHGDETNNRWHSDSGGQESQRYESEFSQNGHIRERDEELGRRQNMEREAAIERSRQKRRVASQSSALSESEASSLPSGYGSVRMMSAFENDTYPDWDQASRDNCIQHKNNDQVMNRTGECWSTTAGCEVRRDEQDSSAQRAEFRMLRRPGSKESEEIIQQFSQMGVQNNGAHDDEEDEDLQLTKLSRPATTIIKRVAPGSTSQGEGTVVQNAHVSTTQSQRKSSVQQQKSAEKKSSDLRNSQAFQRDKVESGQSNERVMQKQKISARNASQQSRATKSKEEPNEAARVATENVQPMLVAPPPTDNVWEKRAEERESAERERAAQRDSFHQMRPQQQFFASDEQPGLGSGAASERHDENTAVGRFKDSFGRSEQQHNRRTGNKSRNRNAHKWSEKKYSYNQNNDVGGTNYYAAEEGDKNEGTDGGTRLFRGQREFVNSRVHRSGRGSSLVNSRGGRAYGRGGFLGVRRGGSLPHQHLGSGQTHRTQYRYERNQRRGRRQEPQEDNFSNMGEFHVEDTYVISPVKEPLKEDKAGEGEISEGAHEQDRHIQNRNTVRKAGLHRNAQQLYEPKKRQEYSRSDRRNGRSGPTKLNSQHNNDVRSAGAYHNPSERGKRKKTNEDGANDENLQRARGSEMYRRGGIRGLQNVRRRRHSGTRSSNAQVVNQSTAAGTGASERTAQLKSPVTSEGHEEWETASESSDIAGRKTQIRRQNAPAKYSNSRRTTRANNGQRRDNSAGGASSRIVSSSKNVKPASTTSHAAARGAHSSKEEAAPTTQGEAARRPDTCRDGLAGVDINNAGVIVIDDRPDGQMDDVTENNDDFEEVLSKKSKKLRQQQINEQLEAEERRKIKEREKLERRKARIQLKRMEKKAAVKDGRAVPEGSNLVNGTTKDAGKSSTTNLGNIGPKEVGQSMGRRILTSAQNTLNTTVWNSSIVREQAGHSSPPIENRPVIPSPIARPTPKTSISSASASSAVIKKEVDLWTGPDEEQRLHVGQKVNDPTTKKNTVEFATNFNTVGNCGENGQYEFTFDPTLQDNAQPMKQSTKASIHGENMVSKPDEASPLTNVALESNDDECLKQKLDKVKDFWPGQQQFPNNLLGNGTDDAAITPVVTDKNGPTSVGVSSIPHGPNVAKVRPQPQTSEQVPSSVAANLKEAGSSTPFVPLLPPPSPIACLPPCLSGAYLQSLSQIPPPAPFSHYSMMFGDAYNPNSSTTSPAQTLIGNPASANQAQTTRSRPGVFLEQSQLFIHPPPNGAAASTWSNGSPQIELLTGINATPPLTSQPVNSVQRFQPRSASAFGPVPSVLSSSNRIPHMGPPPHPHQVPPPLHPPHNFMAPPPDFVPLQGTNLGAVGSQRTCETQSVGNNPLSRNTSGALGRIPHLQPPSQTGYSMSATATFNPAPALHPFTAPPPPIRYPTVQQFASSDANGVVAASWTRASTISVKYANNTMPPMSRPSLPRSQASDRWAVSANLPVQYHGTPNYQNSGKDGTDMVIHGSIDRFQGTHVDSTRGTTPDETDIRASSVSNISASGVAATEQLESSSQQKKAAKV